MYRALALIIFVGLQSGGVESFISPSTLSVRAVASCDESSPTSLHAGMGMAVKKKGKKKKGKKNGVQKAPPFDAAASLLKMEKKYESLMAKSAKVLAKEDDDIQGSDIGVIEYIVAAKSARPATATADLTAVADWVPVAQLCIGRPLRDIEHSEGTSDKVVQAAISYYCREISQAATFGASKFRDVPRQEMLYSVESTDSFQKHVHDHIDGSNANKEGGMTKAEARKALKLEPDTSDKAEIKQAYRKLTFALHPDRFVGVERTSDEEKAGDEEFARVKQGYETLVSGVSDGNESWYESLGGRERSDFVGPVELLSLNDAKLTLDSTTQESVVLGLDPELVQTFVRRNLNA